MAVLSTSQPAGSPSTQGREFIPGTTCHVLPMASCLSPGQASFRCQKTWCTRQAQKHVQLENNYPHPSSLFLGLIQFNLPHHVLLDTIRVPCIGLDAEAVGL